MNSKFNKSNSQWGEYSDSDALLKALYLSSGNCSDIN